MNDLLKSIDQPWIRISLLLLAGGLVIGLAGYLTNIITASSTHEILNDPTQSVRQKLFDGRERLFPYTRLVALYGTPDARVLGSLGEQPLQPTLKRVQKLAKEYQKYSKQQVYPALEIIATVAAAEPTANNDYSREVDMHTLEKWIQAAEKARVYVVLDLQPGRSHFLVQAKTMEKLLRYPHVGLALDPEWRLGKAQRHMEQIGSVHAHEVNQTATWLAGFIEHHNLPQKVFLIHQFRSSMIQQRERLVQHPELAYVIQMDGHGAQTTKQATWRILKEDLPRGIHMGWKNFYNEDLPILTPAQTYKITPVPWFVSYQ